MTLLLKSNDCLLKMFKFTGNVDVSNVDLLSAELFNVLNESLIQIPTNEENKCKLYNLSFFIYSAYLCSLLVSSWYPSILPTVLVAS